MTNSQADPITRFDQRAADFGDILERAAARADAPTPCEGWTVQDVVAHVVATQRDFLAGQELDLPAAPDLGDDLAAGWRAHVAAVSDAVAAEGVAAREYDGFFGRTTIGQTLADFYGWDLVIHGSDVSRATGQSWTVTDEEAAALHATADGWGAALHMEGICAAAIDVPADASTTDRLLARLGRDPGWAPRG